MPRTKIEAIRVALNKKFLERSEVIDGMLVALLSGEPLFMLGPPGTAKSALCHALSDAIGGDYFAYLMTKLTTPEEIFGPLSLKGLDQDKYIRILDGRMAASHIVFLDEIGKTSSALSNCLLTALNEKVFYNDGKAVKIPMLAFFAASNEIPQGEELAAFYDRLVLRYFVEPMREENSMITMLSGNLGQTVPKISLEEIDCARKDSQVVKIPQNITHNVLIKLWRGADNEGFLVSDRKWRQCINLIRANAYLNGHSTVEESDLEILCHVLWSSTEQKPKVRKMLAPYINPLGERILQLMDGMKEMVRSLDAGKGEPIEAFNKIKHTVRELGKLGDPVNNPMLQQALQQAKASQRHIGTKHLNLGLD